MTVGQRTGCHGFTEWAHEAIPAISGGRLELMWGIRHLIVHRGGVATVDFVRRHPHVVEAAGKRVKVNDKDLSIFVQAVTRFVEPTEQFFLARYPALSTDAPPDRTRASSKRRQR